MSGKEKKKKQLSVGEQNKQEVKLANYYSKKIYPR